MSNSINNASSEDSLPSLSTISSSGHSHIADDSSSDQSVAGSFEGRSLTPVHVDHLPALPVSLRRASTSHANLADFSATAATSPLQHTPVLHGRMSQVSSSQTERLPEQLNHAFAQLRAIRNRLSGNNSIVSPQEILQLATAVRRMLTNTTIQYPSTLHDPSAVSEGAVSNANELIRSIANQKDSSDPEPLLAILDTALGHVRTTIEQQSATAVDATTQHPSSPLEHELAHTEALLEGFSDSQDLQPEALQQLTHATQRVNENVRNFYRSNSNDRSYIGLLAADNEHIQEMLETPEKGSYDISYQERSLAVLRPALANVRQAVDQLSITSAQGDSSAMNQASSNQDLG